MKKINLLFLMLLISVFTFAQKSPKQTAEGTANGVKVAINYGAPSVRDRVIWGELEAYGKVWRAGANENTTVTFDKATTIGGKSLAAGKYGFFIIPNKDKDWVVIFNKVNNAWGAYDYKQDEDALRVNIKPNFVAENQEQLKYEVDAKGINFAWAKARLSIPVGK